MDKIFWYNFYLNDIKETVTNQSQLSTYITQMHDQTIIDDYMMMEILKKVETSKWGKCDSAIDYLVM